MAGQRSDQRVLAALVAVTTVTAVVSSLGAPLVPSIAEAYDVPVETAQWVLTAPMLAAAAATPALGRWGSGRLRRPVVLGTLTVVLAGLVLAALPTGIVGLLVGRSLQGLGLGLAPLALAVARDRWAGDALASRLSLLSVATVAGAGLGYPLTAALAGRAGVAGASWFGTALVAGTLLLAAQGLPAQAQGHPQRVDLVGVALMAAGTVAVLLAVSQGDRWPPATVLGLALGGAAALAWWVRHTLVLARRGGQPLVDLALAGRPGVLGPHLVAFALAVGMYGLLTLAVLLVRADGTDGWGLDLGVGQAGLVLVPYALTSVAGSRVALRVARRRGAHVLLPIGCAVFASSLGLLAVSHDHLWQVLLAMAVGGLGSGFTFSSLPMLLLPRVPAAETGSAMAFNQLLRYLGFACGSAVSVALLEGYGAGDAAFRGACLTLAAGCAAAGAGVRWGGGATRLTAHPATPEPDEQRPDRLPDRR